MSIKSFILAAKALLGRLEQIDENGVSYYELEEAKYLHHVIEQYETRNPKVHKVVSNPKYN